MPKLSVVIPVFNSEKYLNICVSSILKQSFENLELILVDDGSTDSSAFLCDEWAKKDLRVSVIHKENQGQGIARNCGIRAAKGEFIAFVDSDDFVEKEMYAQLLNGAEGKDLALCQIKRVFDNGKSLVINDIKNIEYCNKSDVKHNLIMPLAGVLTRTEAQINASSCRGVYKKQIITDNKVFFESERVYLSEDLLFNLKYLSFCERVKCISEPYYCYRDNSNSFSTSYVSGKLARVENLHKKALEILGTEYSQRVSATILGHISVCVKQIIANKTTLGNKAATQLMGEIANNQTTKAALRSCKYLRLQAPLNIFCFLIDIKQLWLLYILISIFLKLNIQK